jgi:hypothetical protein
VCVGRWPNLIRSGTQGTRTSSCLEAEFPARVNVKGTPSVLASRLWSWGRGADRTRELLQHAARPASAFTDFNSPPSPRDRVRNMVSDKLSVRPLHAAAELAVPPTTRQPTRPLTHSPIMESNQLAIIIHHPKTPLPRRAAEYTAGLVPIPRAGEAAIGGSEQCGVASVLRRLRWLCVGAAEAREYGGHVAGAWPCRKLADPFGMWED